MKTVQRTAPGGTLHSSAAHTDTSAHADAAAESDRIDAWLDVYSERTGAHADAIRAEVIRVNGNARITRELIADAAERLASPGSFVADNAPAVYHRPTQQDVAAAKINTDDRAFRAMLAARLDAACDGEAE